jgi:ATP-binding cassette subfamily B protein
MFPTIRPGVPARLRTSPWLLVALSFWPGWVFPIAAWIRANLLESLLRAPGPLAGRLPASAGEAVARFRDDVEDLVWFVDGWVDITGAVVFTVASLVVMVRISPLVTVVAVVPLVGVMAATRGRRPGAGAQTAAPRPGRRVQRSRPAY